jgi:uncharacterized protein
VSIEWTNALLGGVIIGIAVSLMLLWNGRVTGICGIVYATLTPIKGDTAWRISFIVGLFMGGLTLQLFSPESLVSTLAIENRIVVGAGLLVGFGATLGSGCTSGHGVCGISRLSTRSFVATIVFILFGMLAVSFFRAHGVFG